MREHSALLRPDAALRRPARRRPPGRDLFAQAKGMAPAIVSIDELDAVGRSRTAGIAGFSGGNDERKQT